MVTKSHVSESALVQTVLLERVAPYQWLYAPTRMLQRLNSRHELLWRYQPEGSVLSDFAVHPSGETTVLLSTPQGFSLVRLDSDGRASQPMPVNDPEHETDPIPANTTTVNGPIVPAYLTHDSGRLQATGEGVLVAIRVLDSSVLAYRYERDDSTLYRRVWRQQVEPIRDFQKVIGGPAFDAFNQLINHNRVYLQLDEEGNAYIATSSMGTRDFFDPEGASQEDFPEVLITKVSKDGHYVHTSELRTWGAELYGFRIIGDAAYALGRFLSRDDLNGCNGMLWKVDIATGATEYSRAIDIDRGEVLFDLDVTQDGKLLAVGASGYTDNPKGLSVSEEAYLLGLVLDPEGNVVSSLSLPSGPRHNQARTVQVLTTGQVVIGGFVNGPGTHSGDSDESLLRADPYLQVLSDDFTRRLPAR